MNGFNLILIAIGLAMDALAVSIASGVTIKSLQVKNAFKIAFFFGLFQMIMPLIGWLGGSSLQDYVASFDHWIAFILLSIIGIKMLRDSLKPDSADTCPNPLEFPTLLLLSIATSIDALAVGLSLAFLKINIITPVLLIGLITFFLSFSGVYLGNKIGHLFENKIRFAGGLILIGIGFRILIEHLFL